jgi:CelD/BcsL family acetyltransferase involved in cellulose biosynthesis
MVHLLIKIGYDHDFRALSPGMILRLMMLERAFAGSTDT